MWHFSGTEPVLNVKYQNCYIAIYADDTTIIISAVDDSDLEIEVN